MGQSTVRVAFDLFTWSWLWRTPRKLSSADELMVRLTEEGHGQDRGVQSGRRSRRGAAGQLKGRF